MHTSRMHRRSCMTIPLRPVARLRALVAFATCIGLAGCCREVALPTAPSTMRSAADAALASPAGGGADAPGVSLATKLQPPPPRGVVAEASAGLSAIITGEQGYWQREVTFVDAADIGELRDRLGVYLETLGSHWAFNVTGSSVDGFVAGAHGVDGSSAQNILVTLSYQRDGLSVWSVEHQVRDKSDASSVARR